MIASAYRMSDEQRTDFGSLAILHLIDDDCRVLRAFQGRSSLATYLSVVLKRAWHDHQRPGRRWRPSTAARRAGRAAVHLERLVQRDAWPLDQAISWLHLHEGHSHTELSTLWTQLPIRTQRRAVTDDVLETVAVLPDATPAPFERRQVATKVRDSLRRCWPHLAPHDRRVVALRFVHGWTLAAIARHLGVQQREIYPRFMRALVRLRSLLEADGITAHEASEAIGLDFDASEAVAGAWTGRAQAPPVSRQTSSP